MLWVGLHTLVGRRGALGGRTSASHAPHPKPTAARLNQKEFCLTPRPWTWGGKDSRCGPPAATLPDMQKPNYQFEKRRKEQDKKAKKEEKRRLKLAASQSAAGNNEALPVPIKPV